MLLKGKNNVVKTLNYLNVSSKCEGLEYALCVLCTHRPHLPPPPSPPANLISTRAMEDLINGPRAGATEESETAGWTGLVDKWADGGRKLVCYGNEYVIDDDDEDIIGFIPVADE